MKRTIDYDSSWFVRQYHRLTRESWFARLHRRMEAAAPLLFRDFESKNRPADDEPVIRTLQGSVVVRTATSVLALAESWAHHSGTAAAAAVLRNGAAWLTVAQRIRIVALALFTAIVTHLLLTGLDAPEPTAAARIVWAALLAVVAAVLAGSSFLAAAWNDWSTRPGRNGSARE
jgi:hypothetical protein